MNLKIIVILGLSSERLLKPETVPSIYVETSKSANSANRCDRAGARRRKSLVSSIIKAHDIDNNVLEESFVEASVEVEISKMDEPNSSREVDALNIEMYVFWI